jgi:formylglycine-generating enzyme required for sulfatase activity
MMSGEEARRQAAEAQAREHAEQEGRRREAQVEQSRAGAGRRRANEQHLRDVSAAKHGAEEAVGRRRRTVPVLTSLVGLGVLGAAIIVWLTMPAASGPVVQTPPAQVTPTPAAAVSTEAAPLSPMQEKALKPKDTFKECANCPEMVVVPAGSFTRGSPTSEPGHSADEGPQHTVTIARPFAVGRFAVTFDEWDACAADGGCNGYKPADEGWGRGRRPVINVSWDDAKAYVAWLSKKTGKSYRLLSGAEYEYATRAGTQTAYPWGNDIGTNNANCHACGSQWDARQTAPVGSFAPNGFGLYDMVGNIEQWMEDCYHESYSGAPTDGSAWIEGADCSNRIVRAGSWFFAPAFLRSAKRYWFTTDYRLNYLGFRVARTLTP